MARMILSLDGRPVDGLPFGSAALLRATPVAENEISDATIRLRVMEPLTLSSARAGV